MSEPTVIDMEALLTPISAELPGGADPRESASAASLYYRVKDQRNQARADERAAVEVDASVPEAWHGVVAAGTELLSTQAKDLEVAAWLTEALIRTEGFVGLRDGFTLIGRLVESFWDHLFPLPDEDGIETKVSPIAGLNGSGATGTLDRPIRNAAISQGSAGSYSFWTFEQALELEKVTDDRRRAARIAAGAVTMEAFRKSVAETPNEVLQATVTTVAECETALVFLSDKLDAAAGLDSPSMTSLAELLAAVAGCLRHVAADRLAALAQQAAAMAATPDDAPGPVEGPDGTTVGVAPMRRPGEFGNRDEALTALIQIGNYFRRTEPHSPISYTIDDAVRRARMPLGELLRELAQDPTHVQHILLAAGISPREETG